MSLLVQADSDMPAMRGGLEVFFFRFAIDFHVTRC